MKQSSIEWMVEQLRMQTPLYTKEEIIEIAKEMHDDEVNAKIQKAIEKFEEAKSNASSFRDVIYLDGVLSVLDTIKNETLNQ